MGKPPLGLSLKLFSPKLRTELGALPAAPDPASCSGLWGFGVQGARASSLGCSLGFEGLGLRGLGSRVYKVCIRFSRAV